MPRFLKSLICLVFLLHTGEAASLSLTDGRGRVITLEEKPQRIASSSLASDEILLAILKKSGELERLVAVSTLADDPQYSNVHPVPKRIAGRIGGEIESTLKQRPDLAILASFNKPETILRLENAGVRTFVLGNFDTLEDIAANVTLLGRLAFAESAAKALRQEFEGELAKIKAHSRKRGWTPKVLSFLPDGTVSGKNSIFDDIVRAAGGENLAATQGLTGWPRLSAEALITMDPDALVASGDPKEREAILRSVRTSPGFMQMKAAKAGRLVVIPPSKLAAASPHVLEAVRALSQALDALPRPETESVKP